MIVVLFLWSKQKQSTESLLMECRKEHLPLVWYIVWGFVDSKQRHGRQYSLPLEITVRGMFQFRDSPNVILETVLQDLNIINYLYRNSVKKSQALNLVLLLCGKKEREIKKNAGVQFLNAPHRWTATQGCGAGLAEAISLAHLLTYHTLWYRILKN